MRRRGYTLIELVMVVAIVAIIGAVAVPKWLRASQHYQVDLAARRVAADIALARQRANNASTSVTLTFTGNTYKISGMTDFDRPSQAYSVDLSANPYRATVSSIAFGNGTSLTFDGYGNPAQGGSLKITVYDRSKTVSIDATSGKVTIQ